MKKLKEADALLIKEYEIFLEGKKIFNNSKNQIINDINKYYADLKQIFENEYNKNKQIVENYITQIEQEFNTIDELLQNNKRIVDKSINYITLLMNQSFFEVKLSDQLQLMEELKLNTLLDDNNNNKINLFLYQIKNNLFLPQINIDKKVVDLVQQIHDCFSIKTYDKFIYSLNNKTNIHMNNILDEKINNNNNNSNSDNNSLTNKFMNNNPIYLAEETRELKDLIEDLCTYINKMNLNPNFIWFEPNSSNIYEISFQNNVMKAQKTNYNYIQGNYNNINSINNTNEINLNSFFFNEDFRVSNAYNNILYITGGINNNKEIINDTYEYSIIKKDLIKKASMNQKRKDHGIILIGNLLYICGGTEGNFNYLDSCEKYNITEDKWYIISSMNEKLSKINLIQIDNKAFAVFGGLKENNIFNHKIHYYRIDTNNWFILNNVELPYGLIYPGLCKYSSKYILILGGINENNQECNEILRMDISLGKIEKMNNKYLNKSGFCIYSSIYSNKEIHLLLNHCNQKYPDRIITHL